MFTAGLIDYYADVWFKFLNPKRYKELYPDLYPEGPQVLTKEHLEAGFVIWMVSIVVAIAALILEWFIRLKDFFIVKFLFLAFYNQKHHRSINQKFTQATLAFYPRHQKNSKRVLSLTSY